MGETIVEQLLRRKKPVRGSIRLPRTPPARPPMQIERQYQADLRRLVLPALEKSSLTFIKPSLVPALRIMRAENGRFDSSVDELARAFRLARIAFSRTLTDAEIETLAEKYAAAGREYSGKEFGKQMERVLGVNPLTANSNLQPISKEFVKTNTELIKSIGEEFFTKLERDTMDHVKAGVYNKEYAQKLTAEYADEYESQWENGFLKRRVNNAEARSNLIARDQIAKYNTQLARARQTAVGISKYEWSTVGDERVRESHQRNNGKVFSWNNPPATGHPGDDYQCRCVALPIFDAGVTDDPELAALLQS